MVYASFAKSLLIIKSDFQKCSSAVAASFRLKVNKYRKFIINDNILSIKYLLKRT